LAVVRRMRSGARRVVTVHGGGHGWPRPDA
jgi:hypothetical protein